MKRIIYGLIMSAIPAMAMADGADFTVSHLSADNSIVRLVADSGKYLLLPVQEGAPMAHIRVLSDGKLDETLNITLADNKVDYYVPLLISDRGGKNIVLDVTCDPGRSSVRDTHDAVWTKEMKISETFDTTSVD
ncbi:MAG: DUF4980 domain-containing protein [Muribaculaceae bacterium]|nr:DUF4980 domain-containing protein [Muribaculaceae bacterium]